MEQNKKIDVHAHYFPPVYEQALERHQVTILDGAPRPKWSEEIQLSYMEQLNIDCSILSLSSPHFHFGDDEEAEEIARNCNEYGTDLKLRYPGKFKIMGSLPLPDVNAALREIEHCNDTLHVDGFAMQTHYRGIYLGSPILEPIMQELDRVGAAVVIHPTVPAAVPMRVNEKLPAGVTEYFFDTTRAVTNMIVHGVIRRYPRIRFIVPHAGAYLTLLSDRLATLGSVLKLEEGLDVFGDLASLYYDVAGMSMPKQYGLLKKITEESHILYGSDAPFTPPPLCEKLEQDMLKAIEPENLNAVMYQNAVKLFD